ncbi:MAG: hypothetical protein E7559_08255 [Ruminococcaceae bacterium]|nr:hypothetical protein [Oscillospiraceae bacterium]
MRSRHNSALFGLLTALVVILAAFLGITQRSTMPHSCSDIDDPSMSVVSFFDSLCAENVSACDALISGYSSLGLAAEPKDEVGKKLHSQLLESYEYTLIGSPRLEGTVYVQTVDFRYFDIPSTADTLNELSQDRLAYRIHTMAPDEIYDENGNYREDVVNLAFSEATDILLENPEQFYKTRQIDVALMIEDSQWKIVIDDDLKYVLLGGVIN